MNHEQTGGNEEAPPLQPTIWVGSILDYNNGRLHGDWLDATQVEVILLEQVHGILASSPTTAETGDPAEEWAIYDFDDFGAYRVGEHDSLEHVARVARGIREHGPPFAAWAELQDGEPSMLDSFQDAYLGGYDTVDAWADQLMDDTGSRETIERIARDYLGDFARYVRIDTDAFARDAELSGDITVLGKPDGGVWVFASNL